MASNANWMERAFKNAGKKGHSLHDSLGIPRDEKIPAYRVKKAEKSGDAHVRHMAQAAANAKKIRPGQPHRSDFDVRSTGAAR